MGETQNVLLVEVQGSSIIFKNKSSYGLYNFITLFGYYQPFHSANINTLHHPSFKA